ncbi:hypothetical protein H4S06_006184, partial [Coemansia sp. BCRC 34490]
MAFSPLHQQQHQQQHQHNQQQQLPRGVALPPTSPFLTTRGENATLMSQPHNSLAHNLSPRLVDHGSVRGMAAGAAGGGAQAVQGQTHRPGGYAAQGPMFSSSSSSSAAAGPLLAKTSAAAGGAMHHGGLQLQQQQQQQPSSSGSGPPVPSLTAGRLMRNRTLLRQSSGLTNASFHNDLVPQATESFFAPLDEVCSDSGADQQSFVGSQPGAAPSAAPAGSQQPARQQQQQLQLHHSVALPPPPPMGSHFSPSMPSMGAGFHRPLQPHAQAAEWQGSAAPSYYARPQHTQQRHSQALGPHGARNAPDAIFAQMPSFAAPPPQQQQQQQQQAMAADGLLASGMKRARIDRDNTRSFALDEENSNNNNED